MRKHVSSNHSRGGVVKFNPSNTKKCISNFFLHEAAAARAHTHTYKTDVLNLQPTCAEVRTAEQTYFMFTHTSTYLCISISVRSSADIRYFSAPDPDDNPDP